jgi:hypothetical protein
MLSNPFAALSAAVSPAIMQTYVVVMALLVVAGTLFDIIHKQSATYFSAAMPISPRSATASACAVKRTRRPFPGK